MAWKWQMGMRKLHERKEGKILGVVTKLTVTTFSSFKDQYKQMLIVMAMCSATPLSFRAIRRLNWTAEAERKQLTCREKVVLAGLWKHPAVQGSWAAEQGFGWLSPHIHPINTNTLKINHCTNQEWKIKKTVTDIPEYQNHRRADWKVQAIIKQNMDLLRVIFILINFRMLN